MQLARLIEPRESRSFGAKLRQMLRAMQIERRLTKREILERYLTLAPYGGNLEGVRAASLAYFGKEPKRLTVSEAALLVALPQLPERRRPDRNPDGARGARPRARTHGDAGLLAERRGRTRGRRGVPSPPKRIAPARARRPPRRRRAAQPALAIRTAHARTAERPGRSRGRRARGRDEARPEAVGRAGAGRRAHGEILGEVGSADYFDASRSGWIDMTRAVRSPGSTLKPFIYGLAFEQGMVAQETMIEDRPADFAGYRPRNFDMSYQGDVSVRQALQLSLNVPAIRLLDAVGPARLTARFRQAGVTLTCRPASRPASPSASAARHHAARPRPALYRPRQWRPRHRACATARAGSRDRAGCNDAARPTPPGRSPTSWPA
jgi:penicillin-binding protein 1C